MQLQDRQKQLEDVGERWMDAEKEKKCINTYSMCGQVDKDGQFKKLAWNYMTGCANVLTGTV